jgi:hypothetical protein
MWTLPEFARWNHVERGDLENMIQLRVLVDCGGAGLSKYTSSKSDGVPHESFVISLCLSLSLSLSLSLWADFYAYFKC